MIDATLGLIMSSTFFRIHEHVIQGQHVREYPAATAHSQEEPLSLHVKQYVPLNNLKPVPGDVTLIAAHANGFPKVGPDAGLESFVCQLTRAGVV